MAAIAHAVAAQNTLQTTTSTTFVDVSGLALADTDFTAAKKYLLLAPYQFQHATNDADARVQWLHGSTAFADSLDQRDQTVPTARWLVGCWWTVWTAVSGEGIKAQFATDAALGGTTSLDQGALPAINLSDDVTENTDWFYAEDTVDLGLTSTFQDGATITFTPASASDWLVLTLSRIDPNGGTLRSRLNRSGEASSLLPEEVKKPSGSSSPGMLLTTARVFSLTNASNTFTEQSALITGTAGTRLFSSIFALNLNKFRNHAFAWTEGALSLGTTAYGNELQTASLTPDVAGDTLIVSYWGFDANAAARYAQWRVQVDNADEPTGQTTDAYTFRVQTDDSIAGMPLATLPNLSAAAHTIDLDGSVDATTGTPAAVDRLLAAFTMELPAAGAVAAPLRLLVTDMPGPGPRVIAGGIVT